MFSGSVCPTAQKSTSVPQDVTISRQTTAGASTHTAATTTATSPSGSNSKWVSVCVPVGNSRQAKLWQCLHLGRLTGRFSVGLLHIFYKANIKYSAYHNNGSIVAHIQIIISAGFPPNLWLRQNLANWRVQKICWINLPIWSHLQN